MITSYDTSCDQCGRLIRVDIPFICGDWIGVKSLPCECGAGDVGTAKSIDENNDWTHLFMAVKEMLGE